MALPGYLGAAFGDASVTTTGNPTNRLGQFRRTSWIERIEPNPSLNNLHQPFEWMLHQEVSATYFLVAFLLCAVALFSCILVFVKICVRSTTRWHISPLATALTIFHLFGHVEFSTFAMIAKSNDIWTALLKSFCLANFGSFGYLTRLTQPQLPNSLQWHIHKGPAAYTLAVLAVWECVVFIFSPHYFSNHRPRGRSFGEWLLFLGLMWLAATSIDLAVHLPVIKRSGNSNTMIEIFESKETFVKATIALVALFLAPMVPFAFALDLALYDGCLFGSFNTEAGSASTAKQPPKSEIAVITTQPDSSLTSKFKTSARLSLPSEMEVEIAPKIDIDVNVDIALKVEKFLWDQMCFIRGQAQALQAENQSPNGVALAGTYKRLSRVYAVLAISKPVLDHAISVLRLQKQKTERFESYFSTICQTMVALELKMLLILDVYREAKISVQSSPDTDFGDKTEKLTELSQRLTHVKLDRQQVFEDFGDVKEAISIWEERPHGNMERQYNIQKLTTTLETLNSSVERLQGALSAYRASKSRTNGQPSEEVLDDEPEEQSSAVSLRDEVESPQEIGLEINPIVIEDDGQKIAPRSISTIEIVEATADIPSLSPRFSPRIQPFTPETKHRNMQMSPRSASASPDHGDENASARSTRSPPPAVKKSADHMVVGLWENVTSIIFKTDNFLRGAGTGGLLTTDDLLAFCDLGKYLTSKIRGNRAETAAAMKIINNIYNQAMAAKENHSHSYVNVGANNLNYFRSCMWIGQARLTKFPPTSRTRIITELPIEGIIKIAGYGPDGIKSLNMLPLPRETWNEYLVRLEAGSDKKKIKELYEWLERYLGSTPELLNREVPRAEGWDTGVPLDANRCLYRHLENMMLLPPYPPEIEDELSKSSKTRKNTAQGISENLIEQLLTSPTVKPTSSNFSNMLFQPL